MLLGNAAWVNACARSSRRSAHTRNSSLYVVMKSHAHKHFPKLVRNCKECIWHRNTPSFVQIVFFVKLWPCLAWESTSLKPGSHYRSPPPENRSKNLEYLDRLRCSNYRIIDYLVMWGVHRSNLAPPDLLAHKSGLPRSYQTYLIFRISNQDDDGYDYVSTFTIVMRDR